LSAIPRHVAIVMDGNGRWARGRGGLRSDGHRAGVEAVRGVIETCVQRGIAFLTLFAFSSENWGRPREEVLSLMALFVESLQTEVEALHANGVRLRFIGERELLAPELQQRMATAEARTAANTRVSLQIAVSYGGRRDIVLAARQLTAQVAAGTLGVDDIDEPRFAAALALGGLPDPDLFIRTGGEQRISNFLLWNLAYTELYFTDVLWPDFDVPAFDAALRFFSQRHRRFGLTTEQMPS
jgi:undecaprenyl diphosphate synthase